MAAARGNQGTPSVVAYAESGNVRIDYDTWTPRAHFILVLVNRGADATAQELTQAFGMVGRFLQANPQFAPDAILSFHRGVWYKQHTGDWHAHICVPYDPYLEAAEGKINPIPRNREWGSATSVKEGMKNWLKNKEATYAKYQAECIDRRVSPPTEAEKKLLTNFYSSSGEFQLAWSTDTPRLVVIVNSGSKNTATLDSLYKFMTAFHSAAEASLRQVNQEYKNFGCHFCLYVCGQSNIAVTCRNTAVFAANGSAETNQNAVGYIQLDEFLYLDWIPNNIRETWRQAFRRARHIVLT